VEIIDTGSTRCLIDVDFVHKYNVPSIGTATNRVSEGTIDSTIHDLYVSLYDKEKNEITRLRRICAAIPMRSIGRPFDFIIGMDIIGVFDLHLNLAKNLVSFQEI
jgi:hypothetical protein